MTWPCKTGIENYPEFSKRTLRKFAWFPIVTTDRFWVFLQHYEIYQVWMIKRAPVDDKTEVRKSFWETFSIAKLK